MEPRRAVQLALPLSTSPLTGSATLFRFQRQSLHGFILQRVRFSRSRFELRTGPELVRARIASASRAVDGRQREPVQGRATERRRKGIERSSVAYGVQGCNYSAAGAPLSFSHSSFCATLVPLPKKDGIFTVSWYLHRILVSSKYLWDLILH